MTTENTKAPAEQAYQTIYVLDDKKVIEVETDADLIAQQETVLKKDKIKHLTVKTIFSNLPLYPQCKCGKPNLFESKILGNGINRLVGAFCSYDSAIKAHERAVNKEKGRIGC